MAMTKVAGVLCAVALLFTLCHATAPGTSVFNDILNAHNSLRARVSPPASTPLQALQYDSAAESVASNYACNCVWGHNPNRGNFGENLYATTGVNGDLSAIYKTASKSWEDEKQFYSLTATAGTCQSGQVCGHYTQQVWAATSKMGCGHCFCNTGTPFGGFGSGWTIVVCNYASPGNYIGQLPYSIAGSNPPPPPPAASSTDTPTSSSTGTPTPSTSSTQTGTTTASSTPTTSNSLSNTPSESGTASNSLSPLASPSETSSVSGAATTSSTPTLIPSESNTPVPLPSDSSTPAPIPSESNSPAPTESNTPAPSSSSTATVVVSASSTPAPCTNECPANYCGARTACGTTINCGCAEGEYCDGTSCTSCGTACDGNNCGQILNVQCNIYQPCACSDTSLTCSSNFCVAPPCDISQACVAGNLQCGTHTLCGTQANCGECGAGQLCNLGKCENDPCGNCGTNEGCVNRACSCLPGFTRNPAGVCIAPTTGGGAPDFTQSFQTVIGSNFALLEPTTLSVTTTVESILSWKDTKNVIYPFFTQIEFDATASTGRFGVIYYLGQPSHGSSSDGIVVYLDGIGTSNTQLAVKLRYYGSTFDFPLGPIDWSPTETNHVITTLTKDEFNNIVIEWRQGYYSWSCLVSDSYYPDVGEFGFYVHSTSSGAPFVQNVIMYTTSTISVTLVECIDTDAWEAMFLAATNSPPGTSVQILDTDGRNLQNCAKMASFGKEIASAFTFAVTSTSVSSQAITSTFINAVNTGSAAVAGLGVSSASVVPGSAGAVAAGAPTATAATVVATTGAVGGGGGGGGGGSAGGLSGGAIAGIVVGSVAGGIIALGLTAAVVVAVVVAAVVIASKRSDTNETASEGPSRAADQAHRSMRQTVYNLFRRPEGGVDVMGGKKNGHQSITARAPAHPLR